MSKKGLIKSKEKEKKVKRATEIVLVLPDIRSAHNVGSIFRTADAAGVSQIVLCGYTPRPIDKFGRVQKEIAKTALGGEISIPWIYEEDVTKALKSLKEKGFTLVALEQDENSVDYKKFKVSKKTALILGNEVEGLPKSILKKCDSIIEIPMKGEKESLNVGVSTGIAVFRLLGI